MRSGVGSGAVRMKDGRVWVREGSVDSQRVDLYHVKEADWDVVMNISGLPEWHRKFLQVMKDKSPGYVGVKDTAAANILSDDERQKLWWSSRDVTSQLKRYGYAILSAGDTGSIENGLYLYFFEPLEEGEV